MIEWYHVVAYLVVGYVISLLWIRYGDRRHRLSRGVGFVAIMTIAWLGFIPVIMFIIVTEKLIEWAKK